MTRNALALLVAVLFVGIAVLGYLYYEETRARSGIEIQIDEDGITMEEK
ncbi:MAG: hypothetical protein O9292_09630 [Rhodobacteraceae bacterium]|jgi:hypothetical protein|nr:hypothetical protein [Paracoccaceae bacterium]MCZ8152632.1 hypothetical protein [Paracoccaceae bacterium]MCZ8336423.1 hypothetical protein [Paracoccaceae bacterium]